MLFAAISTSNWILIIILVATLAAIITYFTTRATSMPFGYRDPYANWERSGIAGGTKDHFTFGVTDHFNNREVTEEAQVVSLGHQLWIINYRGTGLSRKLDECLVVGKGGHILGDKAAADSNLEYIISPVGHKDPITIMACGTRVSDEMLDEVPQSHRYEHKLQVEKDGHCLVVCLKRDAEAKKPWLLVWRNFSSGEAPLAIHVETGQMDEITSDAIMAMFLRSQPSPRYWDKS